ncbi:hypothetical protein [Streptomyces sp. NPDC101165]|uniref:hypothetical protein n=1 Tax=Streptomyces sp. NPDC101165 TaxID=3366119 RepID=UPI003808ABCC
MRHLTHACAIGALHRGKQVEQFLGDIQDEDQHGIRWISLTPSSEGIGIYLHEVQDIGTDAFWDITEFPPPDPDEEDFGEAAIVPTPAEALEHGERDFGADPAKWVNQGIACSEYLDHRTARADRLQQHEVILSLGIVPGRERAGSPEDAVLAHFGTTDGRKLGLDLLRDAIQRRDGVDVEMALIVSFTFGFTTDHLTPLLHLAKADWHYKHEDVVSALGTLRTANAAEALFFSTQWVPNYLDFDECRALATKAIWALGNTPGPEAEQALARLSESDNKILRETARTVRERRRTP